MRDLIKKYEITKKNAARFMKRGQISEYLQALLEMSKYKRLITASIAN